MLFFYFIGAWLGIGFIVGTILIWITGDENDPPILMSMLLWPLYLAIHLFCWSCRFCNWVNKSWGFWILEKKNSNNNSGTGDLW
jgi:hypothetical protein